MKSLHALSFPERQALLSKFCTQNFVNLFAKNNLPDSVGEKNCENWVGSVAVPVGVAGPINFTLENKQYESYLPLATTEGALVASVNRGLKILNKNNNLRISVKKHGMSRAPVFACQDLDTALLLEKFIQDNFTKIKSVAEKTSRHLQYLSCQVFIRGKYLYARFLFDTDEAMGMNMTTIATQAIATFLEDKFKNIKLLALSSNVCCDKKDSSINGILGRGYEAQLEIVLAEKLVEKILKSKIDKLIKVHTQKNLVGSNIAGSLSQNAHVANVMAAIFIATGQDPAHVVEASKAYLHLEKSAKNLYVSLTLPNLNMGTVGGGTYLPAQSEARNLIGKNLSARELVAATAVAALAGELSLLASLAEHNLACSHQQLGRSHVN